MQIAIFKGKAGKCGMGANGSWPWVITGILDALPDCWHSVWYTRHVVYFSISGRPAHNRVQLLRIVPPPTHRISNVPPAPPPSPQVPPPLPSADPPQPHHKSAASQQLPPSDSHQLPVAHHWRPSPLPANPSAGQLPCLADSAFLQLPPLADPASQQLPLTSQQLMPQAEPVPSLGQPAFLACRWICPSVPWGHGRQAPLMH